MVWSESLTCEDTKGARRMPWHRKPKKGAASCDKPRGGANGLRSVGARMGEPARGHALAPRPEPIGPEEATRGTETSKYPEERKSTEIPRVAASESGPSPNPRRRQPFGGCRAGVADGLPGAEDPGRGQKPPSYRNAMGSAAGAGESPVRETTAAARPDPEYGRARETRPEAGGTTLQG